tara:strand:- start:870 stop:1040 length:171 start_codon:yes stop_codon:yes gene_type:complete
MDKYIEMTLILILSSVAWKPDRNNQPTCLILPFAANRATQQNEIKHSDLPINKNEL